MEAGVVVLVEMEAERCSLLWIATVVPFSLLSYSYGPVMRLVSTT